MSQADKKIDDFAEAEKKRYRKKVTNLKWNILYVFIAIFVVAIWPRQDTVNVEGDLIPLDRHIIQCQEDGQSRVVSVNFDLEARSDDPEKKWVTPGTELFVLKNDNISRNIYKLNTEIAALKQEVKTNWRTATNNSGSVDKAEHTKLVSTMAAKRSELENKQKELDLELEKEKNLRILAPVQGKITSPKNLLSLKDAVFQSKDPMMTISNTAGEWILYLKVPEDKISLVNNYERELKSSSKPSNLQVFYHLSGNSSSQFEGEVYETSVDQREQNAQNPNAERINILKVKINKKDLGLDNPKDVNSLDGAKVQANIVCGRITNFGIIWRTIKESFYSTKFKL